MSAEVTRQLAKIR